MADRNRVVNWRPPWVPVAGGGRFPVRHAWCVGRNYAAHAREMGSDPDRAPPIFFSKPAQSIVNLSEIAFPSSTFELHHEVELVVFLGAGGRHLTGDQIREIIFGYAVGVDLTRRDVQARAKETGGPWETAKGFDQSGPVGEIVPAPRWMPRPEYAIELRVNDNLRQRATLGEMIWPVEELLAQLSAELTLNAGDVVFTGTPAGVGPVVPGDRIRARIEGLPELAFRINPPPGA